MSAGEPWFFGKERALLGWVHRPAPASTGSGSSDPTAAGGSVGLVIVPPFGFEDVSAHRALRLLAIASANAGVLAVRFDLDGTGASAGEDTDPGRLAAWIASIDQACDLARSQGAERLVLVGVRLGAVLATLAASKRSDVEGLVGIAAVAKPKAYLRELYALQKAIGLHDAPPGADTGGVTPAEEVTGFVVTTATRAELGGIDLSKLPERPAPKVMIIDRDDQKGNDAWAAACRENGADVIQVRLPGFVEMMLDPHLTVAPQQIIEATVAFAREIQTQDPLDRPDRQGPGESTNPRKKAVIETSRGAIEEELVEIGGSIFGIVSRPQGTRPKKSLLLVSSGATRQIGPNRMYVTLARRLAAEGVEVLRADLTGIGDSPARRGKESNVVYADTSLGDVTEIVRWMKRQSSTELSVAGLCSGAFHGLRVALDGGPVDVVIPINSPFFRFHPDEPLDFESVRAAGQAIRYKQVLSQGGAWKRILKGQFKFDAAVKVVSRRARSLAIEWSKELARRVKIPLPHDFAQELGRYAEKKKVRFIFSTEDPGYSLVQDQGGKTLPRLTAQGGVALVTIDDADHTFTARWAQHRMLDAVERAVLAP